ncbi:MAG: FAD-dependent oxidoreductase [Chloroflexi bacterium]|nr:FAD-dependent oxidoreductase [Chloroflexota bacterium]MBI3930737.1 FAD-dependent oxidoreductase [Chloroflexota bacterium]
MPKEEIVIVGGGVVGCAIAYFLAREGISSRIIEREAIGSQASGAAIGLLAPLHGLDVKSPLMAPALESFHMHAKLHDELEAETGIDVQYGQVATFLLTLAEEEGNYLKALIPHYKAMGLEAAWCEPEELKEFELNENFRGALGYSQHQVNAYRFNLALARAAELRGVTIQHGEVIGFRCQGKRVSGVTMKKGEIEAEAVVLAMGSWSRFGGYWLGNNIPVEPLRGQVFQLRTKEQIRHSFFYRVFILPKIDGSLNIGTTMEFAGFDNRVTPEGRDFMIQGAVDIMPSLLNAELIGGFAGLRPLSEDGLPILGLLPNWENAYVAAGPGGKGILLSPIIGREIARLISRGSSEIDLQPYNPARFS